MNIYKASNHLEINKTWKDSNNMSFRHQNMNEKSFSSYLEKERRLFEIRAPLPSFKQDQEFKFYFPSNESKKVINDHILPKAPKSISFYIEASKQSPYECQYPKIQKWAGNNKEHYDSLRTQKDASKALQQIKPVTDFVPFYNSSKAPENYDKNEDSSKEASEDQVSFETGKIKKKLKKFSLRRACFRGMSKYYKSKFAIKSKAWQRRKGKKQKTRPMEELVTEYAKEEFAYLDQNKLSIKVDDLIEPLLLVLHSHRYKKIEEFTKDRDFTIVRDVLYLYSSEAKTRFLNDKWLAFLFCHFHRSNADEFLLSNSKGESEIYIQKLKIELQLLQNEAIENTNTLINQ